MSARKLFRALILSMICTPFAFCGESVFKTLPGTWSGTMTIDGQKVEVAELKMSHIKVCDTCKMPAMRLDFVFKDEAYRLPVPDVFFMWGPHLGPNSLSIHSRVHGNAMVGPTSEFVFERQDGKDAERNRLDIVLYKDSVPDSRVTLIYTIDGNKLVASITQGGKKRAELAFTRAEATEEATTKNK